MKRETSGTVFRDLIHVQAGGVCSICSHVLREGNEVVKSRRASVWTLRKTSWLKDLMAVTVALKAMESLLGT